MRGPLNAARLTGVVVFALAGACWAASHSTAVDDRPSGAAADRATPELTVVVREARQQFDLVIDPDGRLLERRAQAQSAPIVIPLLGSAYRAELRRPTWNPQRELHLVETGVDGADVARTKICGLDENPRHVAWQPGTGRLVYVRGIGDDGTLRLRDPRGTEETVLEVGGAIADVCIGPNGTIAVQVVTERMGKERRVDLVVIDESGTRRLVVGESIASFAWRPDGRALVYSVPGELRHVTLDGTTSTVTRWRDQDERLHNHIARRIDIGDDGTIALVMRFAGGRAEGGLQAGAAAHLVGDREVFLLTPEGALRTISVAGEPQEIRWRR